MDGSKDACTALMVGRALLRRPNFRKNKRSDVLARPILPPALLCSLAVNIRAKRQLCPTRIGGRVELRSNSSPSEKNYLTTGQSIPTVR
jgi:hypothetical protein